jgi:hypothetical protein
VGGRGGAGPGGPSIAVVRGGGAATVLTDTVLEFGVPGMNGQSSPTGTVTSAPIARGDFDAN